MSAGSEEAVLARLETVFLEVLWQESVPVRQRSRVNCSSWDSLAQINLMVSIEQEFDVTLTDDEASELNSFETAAQIILEKVAE